MYVLVAARGIAVAETLRSALGTAADVQTAPVGRLTAMLNARRPDLLVVDESSVGTISALTVCRDARRDHQDLPVLYLSTRPGVSDEVRALDSGADSYSVLPCAPELLLARLRALVRRITPSRAETLIFGDLQLDMARRVAQRAGRPLRLTTTEYALLTQFLRNPDVVLTREELIERVWGHDYAGSPGVLDVYVCYLRAKLESDGEPRVIQTVRGAGYVLRRGAAARRGAIAASRLPRRAPATSRSF